MGIENIFTGIFRIAAIMLVEATSYGIILLGNVVPLAFVVRTRRNIAEFGFKGYIGIIAGLEIWLLRLALAIIYILPFHVTVTFFEIPKINLSPFVEIYEGMIIYIVPGYLLLLALLFVIAGGYAKWKRKYSEPRK